LLSKTTLDEEQQQYSSIINNSSESLLHIVNDILDLSKIEAGAFAIKNKPFNLHALLKDLEITYTTIAHEKNLTFNLDLDDEVKNHLLGDPERLKQVLINLISNAIKFTNEGFISLKVSSPVHDEDTSSVQFSVQDSGIGIPNDKLDLIFERFEQLDNALIRQQGGTGLGLAISKMIIESMGGHITVNSKPGKGSTFGFTIRFKNDQQTVLSREMQMQQVPRAVKDPSLSSILLAEDNRVNQLLVHKLLAPFNIQPVIAENGEEVLRLLENQHFDLILMDVQMPLLDGITTTRLIRKYVADKIPIVGMTAYVLPNEIEKCYAAGMNDHIPKPIDEQQLLDTIKKYIYLDENATQPIMFAEKPVSGDFLFLSRLCNGNEAAMNKILDALETQLPLDSRSFENALAGNDPDILRKVIHHMKSTISPLGADSGIANAISAMSELLHNQNNLADLQEPGKQLLSVLENTIEGIKKR
jgi:CheY-like chemotaxis protein